jgi:hypothetical protein
MDRDQGKDLETKTISRDEENRPGAQNPNERGTACTNFLTYFQYLYENHVPF